MNLQERVLRALDYYECRPTHIAQASGVSQAIVHRLVKGLQDGVNSRTLEKLEPFLSLRRPRACIDSLIHKPRKWKQRAMKPTFDLP